MKNLVEIQEKPIRVSRKEKDEKRTLKSWGLLVPKNITEKWFPLSNIDKQKENLPVSFNEEQKQLIEKFVLDFKFSETDINATNNKPNQRLLLARLFDIYFDKFLNELYESSNSESLLSEEQKNLLLEKEIEKQKDEKQREQQKQLDMIEIKSRFKSTYLVKQMLKIDFIDFFTKYGKEESMTILTWLNGGKVNSPIKGEYLSRIISGTCVFDGVPATYSIDKSSNHLLIEKSNSRKSIYFPLKFRELINYVTVDVDKRGNKIEKSFDVQAFLTEKLGERISFNDILSKKSDILRSRNDLFKSDVKNIIDKNQVLPTLGRTKHLARLHRELSKVAKEQSLKG